MKCPHCGVEIHPGFVSEWIAPGVTLESHDRGRQFMVFSMECPSCKRAIIRLNAYRGNFLIQNTLAYPSKPEVRSAAKEVPQDLAEDFNEASAVIGDSTKASAALSRRCVQQLLRLQGYSQHDLAKQIDAALASKTLPSSLALNLDAIRNIGNFAAHPIKDTNSGAIVPVEPEEAEWNLDVLEGLFDFYYVQPAHDQARRDALNSKLTAAGKPPIKS